MEHPRSSARWTSGNGDPANNSAFDVHQYLDRYFDGYDAGAAYATTDGQPYSGSNGQNGAALLDLPGGGQATSWLRSHGFKAMLTEFGFAPATWRPSSSTSMHYDPNATPVQTNGPTAASAMLSFMDANSDVWIGWTAWSGGAVLCPPASGGDAYGLDPGDYNNVVDQPQIATLTAHL